MNRANNDLRDWLDAGGNRLPRAANVTDPWVNNPILLSVFANSIHRPQKCAWMEDNRRAFLNAMAQIKQETILGVDKNTHVEPII